MIIWLRGERKLKGVDSFSGAAQDSQPQPVFLTCLSVVKISFPADVR